MNTSDQINEIAGALAKAQAEIRNPEKDRENPHFKSRYATLASGLDVARPVLAKHGLSVVQTPSVDGDGLFLTTRLLHSSGQWIESEYPVCKIGQQQQMGSALTYARRYSLFALVGIAPDEDDDDGNAANDAGPAGGKSKTRAQADAEKTRSQAGADRARERQRAEAETYVERCITGLEVFSDQDALKGWWKGEEANRTLHFTGADDPLLKQLFEAFVKRGTELASAKGVAA